MKPACSVVTFGEMLIRLSPPAHLRLQQTHALDLVYGGAEANVAIALANMGVPVQYVTRLPENELGLACMQTLRQFGVGCDYIAHGGERLGLYFLEVGAGSRPSRVIYDRAHSSFATIDEGIVHWHEVFARADWFHWSGISPAVSAAAARVTAQAVAAAREAGLIISCDLNYRHNLWQWGEPPHTVMPKLVAHCDLLLANNAQLMLGMPNGPATASAADAIKACSELSRTYPNLKQIAMTCRDYNTAGQQQYTAVLWQKDVQCISQTFTLTGIVDRVGAGDAFMAGLIYGLTTFGEDAQRVIDFAAAATALKYSIAGDANLVSVAEIEQLLAPGIDLDIRR